MFWDSINYKTLSYNFTGKFSQSWPNSSTVDPSRIVGIIIFINGGGPAINTTVYFDNLLIGSHTGMEPPPAGIRLNQIGFYTQAPKKAVCVSAPAGQFFIVSNNKQDTLYSGTLGSLASYAPSGENVRLADFSAFRTPGRYHMLVPSVGYSHPFNIKPSVLHEVSKASIKAFYYQRASTALLPTHAGIWSRAAGHPDHSVIVHPSAASPYRPAGTTISCSRGWYDAGDYNKYVVNSGITTYTVLAMYEHFPQYFDTLHLNIPESNNTVPDVLDEALWNIRWMLTMQDPYDGGVYAKVSNETFGGTIMPAAATSPRYVVMKTTAATLNFSAVMAQAARIFSTFNTQLPGLADSCINAAVKAWKWARRNPTTYWNDALMVNPTISTGAHGDNNVSDEFQWAAWELYITTKVDSFYNASASLVNPSLPGWQNVRALGYYSMVHHKNNVTPIADTFSIRVRLITLANTYRNRINTNAYGTTMENNDYYWGSNGNAANQGMVLIQAFKLTKDSSYLAAALAALDYILGRNATNYCFVTGHGNLSPQNIHHRISAADGIPAPVPGLLAGGPNTDAQNDCGASAYPTSSLKAKAYADLYCSYSTNEVAINWNAAFAYLSSAIEAIYSGVNLTPVQYAPVLPTNISLIIETTSVQNSSSYKKAFSVYPNPASGHISIESNDDDEYEICIFDLQGKCLYSEKFSGSKTHQLSTEYFNSGIYVAQIRSGSHTVNYKIVVE
ncbi:MAG: glycoside hydrolase family 9 protein [Cytophagaceae bacterium]|nr:glycoside hydrolase family 9 protein [Cytophagaceae bacterium]MDW8455930.1 glycoside hydrolase family 9 protein [Cytophagaceae bacterium]